MRMALTPCVLVLCGCAQQGMPQGGHRPAPQGPGVAGAPGSPVSPARPMWPTIEAMSVCSNYHQVMSAVPYPGDAVAANVRSGRVELDFVAGRSGSATDVRVLSATHPTFVDMAYQVVLRLKCQPAGRNARVGIAIPFNNGVD